MSEKFIYQLILNQNEFRPSEDVNNWVLNPYPCSGIDDNTRLRAIQRLKSRMPKHVFIIRDNEISYSGDTKECAEDYSEQLIAYAYDVRFGGFSGAVTSLWHATNTLYFIDDLFFVGYDRTNPMPIVHLLSFLEESKFGPTTFSFGSVSVINDNYDIND